MADIKKGLGAQHQPCCGGSRPGRRSILQGTLGLGLLPLAGPALAQDAIKNARPQEGDILVHDEDTPKANQPIAPSDVEFDGMPVIGVPKDRASGVLRDGSRLNRVVLVRLKPESMSATTRGLSADGIVAFSSICTHEGCDILGWIADKALLECPCHQSAFDPKDNGALVTGPATRRIPAIAIRIDNDHVVVAGQFIGRPGVIA